MHVSKRHLRRLVLTSGFLDCLGVLTSCLRIGELRELVQKSGRGDNKVTKIGTTTTLLMLCFLQVSFLPSHSLSPLPTPFGTTFWPALHKQVFKALSSLSKVSLHPVLLLIFSEILYFRPPVILARIARMCQGVPPGFCLPQISAD